MMVLELVDVSYGFANPDKVLATVAIILESALLEILYFFTHHSPTSILIARLLKQPYFNFLDDNFSNFYKK